MIEHDRINQVRHFEFKFEEFEAGGTLLHELLVPMRMRYSFRYELELLLKTAGFEIADLFRDYSKNPYDGTGEMIIVAQRPQ